MTKAEQKKLHADPRYRAAKAEWEALRAAIAAFSEKWKGLRAHTEPEHFDVNAYRALRPTRDVIRIQELQRDGWSPCGTIEFETLSRTKINGEYPRSGDSVTRGFYSRRVHPDDLAAIERGELVPATAKKWGAP